MLCLRRVSLATIAALALGLTASGAGAADETLAVGQPAVGPTALDAQTVGAAPEDDTRRAVLAEMPETAAGDAAFAQPTHAASGVAISGGAISASSLSATVGGGVSLGN